MIITERKLRSLIRSVIIENTKSYISWFDERPFEEPKVSIKSQYSQRDEQERQRRLETGADTQALHFAEKEREDFLKFNELAKLDKDALSALRQWAEYEDEKAKYTFSKFRESFKDYASKESLESISTVLKHELLKDSYHPNEELDTLKNKEFTLEFIEKFFRLI